MSYQIPLASGVMDLDAGCWREPFKVSELGGVIAKYKSIVPSVLGADARVCVCVSYTHTITVDFNPRSVVQAFIHVSF